MKFIALAAAIGYVLSVLVGTETLVTLIAVWAMYVFLIQRKPASVYRRRTR